MFEAGEVAGSGAVEGVAVPVGVQPDQVERDRGVDVFEPGFGQPAVAGAADPGDRDGLADGSLDPCSAGVVGLPVRGVLGGPGGELGVVDLAWGHGELAAVLGVGGAGALVADRAGSAGGGRELDHDGVGAALGDRVPAGGALALRAGGLGGCRSRW